MRTTRSTLAIIIATAFAGAALSSAALAENSPSTPAGASPNKPEATTGALAASGPESRADVKGQAKAANRAGEIPKGEALSTKQHPKGGAVEPRSGAGESRAEVKSEARDANKSGDIVKGEAGVSAKHRKGGAVGDKHADDSSAAPSRADVKSEARAANKSGDIVKGEADVKIKP